MILGNSETQIVKEAVSCQSEIADGVVQYDYEDGEIFGAGFTTGTVENPTNPFIEVFRLPQGERGEIDCRCWENGDCPFWVEADECFDDIMTDEFGDDRVTCCINAYIDDGFDDDFDNNYRESVEQQIREVLNRYIGDTLEKLNDIRIAIDDIVEPWNYVNTRQRDWVCECMDSYVDTALENGFTTTDCSAIEYVDGDVETMALALEHSDDERLVKCSHLLREGKLDEVLETLQ